MKKIIDDIAFFIGLIIPLAILCLFFMFLIQWSENNNKECIENGGKVIDNFSIYDSCVYGSDD